MNLSHNYFTNSFVKTHRQPASFLSFATIIYISLILTSVALSSNVAVAFASSSSSPSTPNTKIIINSSSSSNNKNNNMSSPTPIRKVMVTGANGYLASHIVQTLLAKGYTVHACVRDATKSSSIQHLTSLPIATSQNLKFFTTGDMGDETLRGRYDEPMKDCDAVIHAATPLSPKLSGREFDGVRDMLNPGMAGTKEVLESILKKCRDSSSSSSPPIQALVLTSSMSAAAPVPEPPIKDESHWSDDDAQLSRKNFYGCLKTRQERLCHEWTKSEKKEKGSLPDNFRFAAVCPTMIIGPPIVSEGIKYTPSGTMGALYKWITGGRPTAPNDSMSFIHVKDCAAMHVAAMEGGSGRYFSLVESWHWNDILDTLKEIYPNIPPFELYRGEDVVVPTKFNLERMNSLGVDVMGVRDTLKDSVEFFKGHGLLE